MHHATARAWLHANREALITTDYIVDETLTLLRRRNEPQRALELGDAFFAGSLTTLYILSEADLHQAWDIFRRFDDKPWSFTDCTSRFVMDKLGLTTAFSFDRHFQQFGTVTVVP
jgi:predicted nucleic acid-binding protein